MKKHEIHAAIIRMQSEQMALCPEIPIEYYSIYRQHKPRDPTQAGTSRNDSENSDLAYIIGKRISQIIRRVLK